MTKLVIVVGLIIGACYLVYYVILYGYKVISFVMKGILEMMTIFEVSTRRFNPIIRYKYNIKYKAWLNKMTRIKKYNQAKSSEYDKQLANWNLLIEQDFKNSLQLWETDCQKAMEEAKRLTELYENEKGKIIKDIEETNRQKQEKITKINEDEMAAYKNKTTDIKNMKNRIVKYLSGGIEERNKNAVSDYFRIAFLMIKLPFSFSQTVLLDYNPETGTLLLYYRLPTEEDLLTIKEAKYIKKSSSFTLKSYSEKELDRIYKAVIYQIALCISNHLYTCDKTGLLQNILFHGWVDKLQKSTGKNAKAIVIAYQANRDIFANINLAKVDAYECFHRTLKGMGAPSIGEVVPIPPIARLDKEDPRFVEGYNVIEAVNDTTNLAIMEWQDFENLVRDIFEKKYSKQGMEIKITQSSRDKGVDAILFDPDPVMGGKIIIQAKRYANIVGVSAVRDLFGTMMNEGAMKGILVTTSDFGNDSYAFAKDKPITLINGNELLYLMAKEGYEARINLAEAKELQKENDSTLEH